MVRQLERLARGERVRGVPLVDLDRQAPAAKAEPEGEPGQVPAAAGVRSAAGRHDRAFHPDRRRRPVQTPASEILAGIGLAF